MSKTPSSRTNAVAEFASPRGLGGRDVDLNMQQLSTRHLLPNLKRHAISSGFVTIATQGGKFVLNLVSIVVLARLLAPRDFGLVTMVTSALGLLRVFRDAGLSAATIQSEQLTHAQVSNLFWINLGLGSVLTAVAAGSAPALAWFYGDSRLIPITLAFSVTYLLNGSTIQHRALLNRQMRFKAIALIDIGSMVVSLITGISMALLGCGYWSLVGMSIASEGIGAILTWSASVWRPQFVRWGVGTKRLVGFGANLTGAGLFYAVSRSVDTLLLGRRYGAVSVGFYSRATALMMRPLDLLLSPVSAVVIPTLSRLQSEPERYRRTFLQVYESIALVGFSVTGLLLALAHPLTLVLLGPKWEGTAPIFAGFTASALYGPLAMAATWLFTSQGRGRDTLVTQCVLSTVTVASVFAGLPFGPVGVAIAFSVSGVCVRLPVLYYLAGSQGPVKRTDLWTVFFRHLPLWAVVFAITSLTLTLVTNFRPLGQLFVCASAGLLACLGFIYSFKPQRQVASFMLEILRELRQRRMKEKCAYAKTR